MFGAGRRVHMDVKVDWEHIFTSAQTVLISSQSIVDITLIFWKLNTLRSKVQCAAMWKKRGEQ